MKIKLVAAATLLTAPAAAAFTLHRNSNSLITRPLIDNRAAVSSSTGTSLSSTAPCDIPQDVAPVDLVSQKGSASILRSVVLTNVDGDFISLGKLMGKGKSVVVFLRHMG